MKKHEVYIVVAADENGGIGNNGIIPWKFKKEIKFFKDTTTKTKDPRKQNMVIMGRTTWISIPSKYRPLPKRKNVVLSRNEDYKADGAEIAHSINEAFELADESIETIYVIGGGKVYEELISHPRLTGIYFTKIYNSYDCDTYFPEIPEKFFKKPKQLGREEENGVEYKYLLYRS